jgi:hypothetical protein
VRWRVSILVDDDEALLGELQAVVGLEAVEIAALQALPGAELSDVIRQGLEASVSADHVDLLVSHRVVRPLGSETDARSIVEPQTAPFRLLSWHFQPAQMR